MKTLVLLLLLSVVATTLVQSLPKNAEVGEKDIEHLFSLFWRVILKNKQSWEFTEFLIKKSVIVNILPCEYFLVHLILIVISIIYKSIKSYS